MLLYKDFIITASSNFPHWHVGFLFIYFLSVLIPYITISPLSNNIQVIIL